MEKQSLKWGPVVVVEQVLRSATLDRLIADVREVVGAGHDAADTSAAVAERLQPYLQDESLLLPEQQEPDPNHYRQHVLHVEPGGSFSIVSLCWLPGQETPIHDHVSWCVVGVHQGLELETNYRLAVDADGEETLAETEILSCTPGMTEALTPPGDIHKVSNAGDDLAISIHIYGADIGKLGSSILRRYEQPVV
ncbi:MAG: cysteine dioxygenase family protein [Thermomicrobiales bacterium]